MHTNTVKHLSVLETMNNAFHHFVLRILLVIYFTAAARSIFIQIKIITQFFKFSMTKKLLLLLLLTVIFYLLSVIYKCNLIIIIGYIHTWVIQKYVHQLWQQSKKKKKCLQFGNASSVIFFSLK